MLWIPLIGPFSGMRSNEICQLRKSDVQRKDGVWIFNVSADHESQNLKTEAATRIVPVHSAHDRFLLMCFLLCGNRAIIKTL